MERVLGLISKPLKNQWFCVIIGLRKNEIESIKMETKTYQELVIENQKLYKEKSNLECNIKNLNNEIVELKAQVENQQLHINVLNRYIFGSKKESTPKEEIIVEGTQYSIFGEIEDE